MSSREKIIDLVDDLPAIPVSAAKAISMLQDKDVNMSEIIKVIEYDPGITANVFKTC